MAFIKDDQVERTKFEKTFEKFKNGHFKEFEKDYSKLADNQSPELLFITCSDSRILVHAMTDHRPGEVFVVRCAGNIVPYYSKKSPCITSASIEFALNLLPIKEIIVCSHSNCGAIQALKGLDIQQKIPLFKEFKKKLDLKNLDLEELTVEELTKLNLTSQVKNLLSYPKVKDRLSNNEISIHGYYYILESASLEHVINAKKIV